MNEKKLMEKILRELERDFYIETEVPGTYRISDSEIKKYRIDAIIKPKNPTLWKRRDISLGIEFKTPIRMNKSNTYTRLMSQCLSYALTDFGPEYGRIPIFAYGTFLPEHSDSTLSHWVPRIIGEFNVGQLIHLKNYGLSLVMKGSHRIWSSANGAETGAEWNLNPKFPYCY